MPVLHNLACLLSGMLLANTVPHFVHGVSGDRFPTPFSKPPGKGLSSPTTNMAWALVNLVAGSALARFGGLVHGGNLKLALFFAGVAALGLWSSRIFAQKHTH
ncbi:hypothetical protein GALL_139240 [mine drainage metagenome]|uniref:Uncharacterized protein n=1 Tax=mine drainage metagenome TaxID=410659 RepID=A0A1J5S7S4_9ZZZZ